MMEEILKTVDIQIRGNDPPETRATYERLRAQGYSDEEARNLIGAVMANEIYDVLKSQKPFDTERFVARLAKLPQTPWK